MEWLSKKQIISWVAVRFTRLSVSKSKQSGPKEASSKAFVLRDKCPAPQTASLLHTLTTSTILLEAVFDSPILKVHSIINGFTRLNPSQYCPSHQPVPCASHKPTLNIYCRNFEPSPKQHLKGILYHQK